MQNNNNSTLKNFVYYLYDDFLPMTDCSNATTFIGYEYELLKQGLSQLSSQENFLYTFVCKHWKNFESGQDHFYSLLQNRSNIGIFGGLTISAERLNWGYMFSNPTLQDNLIAVSYAPKSNEFILASFIDYTVTMTYFLSFILVGILFFLYEKNINPDYGQNIFSAIFQGFWHTYLAMYRIATKIRSFQSKCLQSALTFTSLFIITMLICSILLSFKKTDFTQLQPPAKLHHHTAFTYQIYKDIVSSYGISLYKEEFDDSSSASDLCQALKNGKFDYLILDASVLTRYVQSNAGFQISTLDFFQYNIGIMMIESEENKEFMRITNKALSLAKSNITFVNENTNKYFSFMVTSKRKSFLENGEDILDPIDYNTFLGIAIVFIIILIVSLIAKLFQSKMTMFFKSKKVTNKLIKKLTDPEAQILKKITVFYEILTEKWIGMVRVFEQNQPTIMENEKNCIYLIDKIYGKTDTLLNVNNSLEKEFPRAENMIKSASFSYKKSKFLKSLSTKMKKEKKLRNLEDFDFQSFDKEQKERLKVE